MPVRKIPRNHRSITGMVAGTITNRAAAFESSLERDLLILLDFDLNVAAYEEQPVRIHYTDGQGRLHTYTPDVLVSYRTDIIPAKEMSPLLAEVKYRKDLFANWKELKPKLRAARTYARERGWRFQILTECEIRTSYLDNAKFLRQYRRIESDWDTIHLLLDTLYELRTATPQSLLLACFKDPINRAELIPVLWQLVAQHRIGTDLNLPLTMYSHIWSVD